MENGSRLSDDQIAKMHAAFPMKVVEGGSLFTGPVRLSFPALAEKTAYQGGTPKFQAAGLFATKEIGVMVDVVRAAVRQHYPNVTDPDLMIDRWNKDHPIRDQGLKVSSENGGRALGKSTTGYVPGLVFINAKSGNQVPCFRSENSRWVNVFDPDEIKKLFYGGAWAQLKVNPYKNTGKNPGIAWGLQGVWKLADDNSFGSGGAGGASADEGGDAGSAFTIEDPNAALTASGGGWGGTSVQNQWD